jgi:circadian clock protein KaiB
MNPITLKLYVTGRTSRSDQAIENVKKIYSALGENANLIIIDVLDDPDTAEKDKILATPTLIREDVDKYRRVIGDMSDIPRLLSWLDLEAYSDKISKEV